MLLIIAPINPRTAKRLKVTIVEVNAPMEASTPGGTICATMIFDGNKVSIFSNTPAKTSVNANIAICGMLKASFS